MFNLEYSTINLYLSCSTLESGYLAHAPDESTTATYVLDSGTRGLASSILLTALFMMSFDFDLKLTVVKTACMYAIVAKYNIIHTTYLGRVGGV